MSSEKSDKMETLHNQLAHYFEKIGWELVLTKNDGFTYYSFHPKNENNKHSFYSKHISILYDRYRNKLEITGGWPKDYKPIDIYINNQRQAYPNISMSPDKGVEKIFQDIQRRFLGEYERLWELCKARQDSANERAEKHKEVAKSVFALLGKDWTGKEENKEISTIHEKDMEIYIYYDLECNLTIHNLPYDKLEKMVKFYQSL